MTAPWWQRGVLYQIYLRSFADSNGDGVGDLEGVTQHLDHLEWLGVDGLWLSPVSVSPNADWGYDVADYCSVDTSLGTLASLDHLIDEARRRDLAIVMDLIPNHTSEDHPWFLDSRSSIGSAHRDWYVWADPKPDGTPPNNWVSSFGGPAWTLDETTGQYYLHNHLTSQPDLNWWNEEVRDAFDDIMRFWFDRGVAGFRIDVCNLIIKDAELRDNPPATENDDLEAQMFGQRAVYNGNRPEVHDVIRRWRTLADSYDPPRVLLGETPVKVPTLAAYYGDGADELHLAFNFPFIDAPLEEGIMRGIVEDTEALLPSGGWPAWVGSNHDMSRLASRWAGGDPEKTRLALLVLLCLRGTPVLYQGDEIGLTDVDVAHEDMRDPLGVLYWPHYAGRDAMRTPMPWCDAPGAGFTDPDVIPWLPLGDLACNVESQRDDRTSVLTLTRDLLHLRRSTPDLATGSSRTMSTVPGLWAWNRGEAHVIVANFTDGDAEIEGLGGRILLSTDRRRDGERLDGSAHIGAWEAFVVEGAG